LPHSARLSYQEHPYLQPQFDIRPLPVKQAAQ
jgi:hypothetical protein